MALFWETNLKCRYCKHSYHVTELDVQYADLKQEGFFTPDFQYFATCPECNERFILMLPSDTALGVQKRIYES